MGRRIGFALVLALTAFASSALGAASYADRAGDDNEAPDITSLKVVESGTGSLTITLTVANFQTLPAESWVNVWFDLDSNAATGADGDEALVRYSEDGSLELYVWDGTRLTERSTDLLTGTFAAGTLTLSVPKAELGATSSFGILAVAARGQQVGDEELIAADFLPEDGRSAYTGPAEATFTDATGDHDAAPDMTAIRVVDGKDGWVRFSVTTPNYATLQDDSLIVLFVDADNRPSTGDGGSEVRISVFGGELLLERWQPARRRWALGDGGTRVRVASSGGVVQLDVHRSELGCGTRFGFAFVAGKVNLGTESVVALDFAPEGNGFYRYALVNPPKLVAGRPSTVPVRPVAGQQVTVSTRVALADTGAVVTSGRVTCRVAVDGRPVRAAGRFAARRAACTFEVPAGARRARGTITVQSAGITVVAPFSFRIR